MRVSNLDGAKQIGIPSEIVAKKPILMQSDWQSVEKKYASVRSHEFLHPKNVGNWFSSPQNESEVSTKTYPELFPACPGGQLQEIAVSAFSIQLR